MYAAKHVYIENYDYHIEIETRINNPNERGVFGSKTGGLTICLNESL